MLVLAAIALILSGGVTYLAYRVLQTRLKPADETTQVVVAAKIITMGSRLTKEDVQLANWPRSNPVLGSFSDPNLVIGRAIMMPVQVNEPITESKLAPKEGGAGLMAVIPEGLRALTIQVNSIIGVSGFVVPGARVDMILTAVPPEGAEGAKGQEMGSKIVLENLEVLAAGQNVQKEVDGKPQSVQDVTLLLTPEQAERVALATGDGRIQLALRNPLDKEAVSPPLVGRSDLYAGPTTPDGIEKSPTSPKNPVKPRVGVMVRREAPVKARVAATPEPPPPPPKTSVFIVELIQGSKRANETFDQKKKF